jgi:hypothetical protein
VQEESERPVASGRVCGDCGLCCKLIGIDELDKPAGRWCDHWKAGGGCSIYAQRPGECRSFLCGWMENGRLGDEWKPTQSRIVLYMTEGNRLFAHVDPNFSNAWRQKPYYEALKTWARQGLAEGIRVIVRVNDRLIVVLPDKDVDLGHVAKGHRIFIGEKMTPRGLELVAEKIE